MLPPPSPCGYANLLHVEECSADKYDDVLLMAWLLQEDAICSRLLLPDSASSCYVSSNKLPAYQEENGRPVAIEYRYNFKTSSMCFLKIAPCVQAWWIGKNLVVDE